MRSRRIHVKPIVMSCGVSVMLLVAGCSAAEAPPDAESVPPTGAASQSQSSSPSAAPSLAATPTASAAPTVPATASTVVPAPPPSPTAPLTEPPPAFTEAPRIPTEQASAAEGFAACASRYQQRLDGIVLGGAVTPVLLERWAEAFESASALAAEGDEKAAAAACSRLQQEMDAVL